MPNLLYPYPRLCYNVNRGIGSSNNLPKERDEKVKNRLPGYRTIGKGTATVLALLALLLTLSSMNTAAAPSGPGKESKSISRPNDTVQHFQDVAVGSFWYNYTSILYTQGIISGYICGTPPAGACVPPDNLPYYVSNDNVTRGQMSRYVAQARTQAGISISSNPSEVVFSIDTTNAVTSGIALHGSVTAGGTDRTINGLSEAVFGHGYAMTDSIGLVGTSEHDNGAWITTQAPTTFYGLFVNQGGIQVGTAGDTTSDVYIANNLIVGGSKTGYVVDIMRNTGSTDLHPGEVAVAGTDDSSTAILGNIPVASVAQSSKPYDAGVLGVVDQRWIPGDPSAPIGSKSSSGYYDLHTTVIHPGEYMSVVTLGAYHGVKVDASNGPIHVGDLLTTSGTAGAAMKVTDKVAANGAIVGKALSSLASGSGTVTVMVTLK